MLIEKIELENIRILVMLIRMMRVESHMSASERNIFEELRELNVLLQGVPKELAQEARAQFLKERTVRKSQL